jgi:hypothetical protein
MHGWAGDLRELGTAPRCEHRPRKWGMRHPKSNAVFVFAAGAMAATTEMQRLRVPNLVFNHNDIGAI